MAHGNPIYHVCRECKQYILNPRFSPSPSCTICNKISEQITKEDLKLSGGYTATITKHNVKVGCQSFSHEIIKKLYQLSVKAQKS